MNKSQVKKEESKALSIIQETLDDTIEKLELEFSAKILGKNVKISVHDHYTGKSQIVDGTIVGTTLSVNYGDYSEPSCYFEVHVSYIDPKNGHLVTENNINIANALHYDRLTFVD